MRHLLEKKCAEHRHERERKNERAEQRERNREGERAEHLAFEPLQGEERQEDNDDDEDAEDDRATDFFRGIKHGLDLVRVRRAMSAGSRLLGEMSMDVLHHHDGAIDHHADADGESA